MDKITEKMGVHKDWYKQAEDKAMTLEKLPEFLKHLTEDYQHDYGTICHAITAGAIATMWAMDRTPQGGITGFQGSCIMWEFIKNWMHYEGLLKLLQYKHMLFPQYQDKFEKNISSETWEWLQKEAKKNLELEKEDAVESVKKHWQSIVDGIVPFGFVVNDD